MPKWQRYARTLYIHPHVCTTPPEYPKPSASPVPQCFTHHMDRIHPRPGIPLRHSQPAAAAAAAVALHGRLVQLQDQLQQRADLGLLTSRLWSPTSLTLSSLDKEFLFKHSDSVPATATIYRSTTQTAPINELNNASRYGGTDYTLPRLSVKGSSFKGTD